MQGTWKRTSNGSGVMRLAVKPDLRRLVREETAPLFRKVPSPESALNAVERAYDQGYQAGIRDAERGGRTRPSGGGVDMIDYWNNGCRETPE